MSEQDYITVKAGPNSSGNRVAIYEENELHPNGQALVYGDKEEQVYPTEEVVIRIREGFLKEVRGGQRQQPQQDTAAQRKAREKAEAEAKENS